MNRRLLVKKVVVTTVANVPGIKTLKDNFVAGVRRLLKSPHQDGYRCISLLAPNDTSLFLDVGANTGQCIESIRLFAPKSPIVSFEPNPMLVQFLQNRFRADSNLRVECLAAGAQPGQFDLFVPSYRGQVFHELASLDGEAVARWLPDRIWGFRPTLHRVEKIHCKVCRLDDLKLAPFLLKIDVCCLQPAVVRGALATIKEHRPFIILRSARFEGESRELLAPLGYHMYGYEKAKFREVSACPGSSCLIPDEKKAKMPAGLFV